MKLPTKRVVTIEQQVNSMERQIATLLLHVQGIQDESETLKTLNQELAETIRLFAEDWQQVARSIAGEGS